MKKLIITTAIVLGFGLTSFAAYNGGGLFQRGVSDEEFYGAGNWRTDDPNGPLMSNLPNHGESNNGDAPLGTGIVLLSVLGGAYLVGKKRREE